MFVLLFPAVTAMSSVGMGLAGSSSSLTLVEGGPLQMISYVLTRSDSGGQLEAGAALLRGVVLLAGALWLLRPRRPERRVRPVLLCMGAFLVLVLVSALTSTHLRDALAAWGDSLAMALCFAMAADLAAEYRDLPVLHLASVVVVAAVAMVLPAAWYIFGINPDPNAAMFGSFYQPNMLAGYLLLGLPLAAACLFSVDREDDSERLVALLGGLLLGALAVSLYYSYSRAAWACGLLGMLLPLALLPKVAPRGLVLRVAVTLSAFVAAGGGAALVLLGSWAAGVTLAGLGLAGVAWLLGTLPGLRRRAALLVLVLLVSIGLVWGLGKESTLVSAHAVRRAGELASGQDNSGAARLEFYRAALQIAAQHPLLGVGPEGFHRYYPAVQEDLRWFAKYTHSVTMTLLSETGFPAALLFYGGVLLGAVLLLRRAAADEGDPEWPVAERTLRLGMGLGVLVFLVHAQFDVDFHFVALPLTAAFLAGVALGAPARGEPVEEPVPEEPRSDWSIRPTMLVQYLGSLALLVLLGLNAVGSMGDFMGAQARVAADHRREDLALQYYRLAAQWDPLQGEHQRQAALLLLGEFYAGRGNAELAGELLARSAEAVALDPHRAVSQSTRGRSLEAVGRWQEAEPFFRRALELDPVNYPSFYLDVARLMARGNDLAGARSFLVAALPRFPRDVKGQMFNFRSEAIDDQLSDVYLNLALLTPPGAPERMAWLEKSVELSPAARGSRFALAAERYELARQLERQGKADQATAIFQQVARVFQELYGEEPGFRPVGEYLRDLRRRGFPRG